MLSVIRLSSFALLVSDGTGINCFYLQQGILASGCNLEPNFRFVFEKKFESWSRLFFVTLSPNGIDKYKLCF